MAWVGSTLCTWPNPTWLLSSLGSLGGILTLLSTPTLCSSTLLNSPTPCSSTLLTSATLCSSLLTSSFLTSPTTFSTSCLLSEVGSSETGEGMRGVCGEEVEVLLPTSRWEMGGLILPPPSLLPTSSPWDICL